MKAEFVLFVSDLHLKPEEPATAEHFFRFLTDAAPGGRALYILGDLFEAWVGDDDLDTPLHAGVATALRQVSDSGVEVYVMHGNRDFLLGANFCQASGSQLLAEPCVIDLHGTRTLLLHGDSLCTDDVRYQQFRAQMRNPAWQQAMLDRPLVERRILAKQLREQSELAKDGKSMAIMDVNAGAVAEALRGSGCQRLIHGHTHRPAYHEHLVDGRECERWVLPDWHEGRGGYLRCDDTGCGLIDY